MKRLLAATALVGLALTGCQPSDRDAADLPSGDTGPGFFTTPRGGVGIDTGSGFVITPKGGIGIDLGGGLYIDPSGGIGIGIPLG